MTRTLSIYNKLEYTSYSKTSSGVTRDKESCLKYLGTRINKTASGQENLRVVHYTTNIWFTNMSGQ